MCVFLRSRREDDRTQDHDRDPLLIRKSTFLFGRSEARRVTTLLLATFMRARRTPLSPNSFRGCSRRTSTDRQRFPKNDAESELLDCRTLGVHLEDSD